MALQPSITDVVDALGTVGMAFYVGRNLTTKTLNSVKGFEGIPIPVAGERSKIGVTGAGDESTKEIAGRRAAGTLTSTLFLQKTDAGQKALADAEASGEVIVCWLCVKGCAEPTLLANAFVDPPASAANRYIKWTGTVSQFSDQGEQDNVFKTAFGMAIDSVTNLLRAP